MARIKILYGGCGISYIDEHGKERQALKTPESGPFECDDAQAARLVNLGVAAVYIDGIGWQKVGDTVSFADTQQEEQADGSQETEQTTGHLDAEQLEEMSYNDLKKLAADMGVKPEGKTKQDYITALVAADVELGDEIEPDEDDDLPELNAVDPE